jgi:hypothetical protein
MSVEWCKSITLEAIEKYVKPEIFNADQVSQFTLTVFINELKRHEIKILWMEKVEHLTISTSNVFGEESNMNIFT